MSISHRFLQSLLKTLVRVSLSGLILPAFAQAPAAGSASSEASSQASAEKPIYSSTTERDNALLANAFTAIAKPEEIKWLETPSEKIISLYKTGETRKPKGVLLILHAPEVPQLWPASLENLRRNLPIYGWATMALPLPGKYLTEAPQRESSLASSAAAESSSSGGAAASAETSSTAAETPKPVIPRSQLITERVEAAVAELNKLGQFNLVVLVDNSSAPDALATLYKKINKGTTTSDTIDGPLQALVLMNLQNQEPLTKEQLVAVFSVGDLPVMDVFFNPDNQIQPEIMRAHHAEAMRQNVKDYQQITLPPEQAILIDDKQSFWLGKIHGFATKKAEGNEVSNKPVNRGPQPQ